MKFISYSKLFIKEHKILVSIITLILLSIATLSVIDHWRYNQYVKITDEFWYDSSDIVYLMNDDMDYKNPFSDFTKNKIEEYANKYKNDINMTENDELLFRDVLELNVQYNKLLLKELIGKGSISEYDRIQELKKKLKEDYDID